MKKRIRDIRERDGDDRVFTYGRPSVSAWIAAGAVAFAVFVLGGFIRTYRQLDVVREESQREIAELRETVRRLREERAAFAAPAAPRGATGAYSGRVPALPPARRDGGGIQQYSSTAIGVAPAPGYDPAYDMTGTGQGGRALRSDSQRLAQPARQGLDLSYLDEYAASSAERPRYQLGRTYEGEDPPLVGYGGGPCQVISVSGDRKRLIVEGGRDLGLTEGARLELCRDGRWAADIRIVDVYDNQSSCEVLHATVTPQPGDTIRRPPQSR